MLSIFTRLMGDKRGVTALEYGVLAAGIVVAVAASATIMGAKLGNLFSSIVGNL